MFCCLKGKKFPRSDIESKISPHVFTAETDRGLNQTCETAKIYHRRWMWWSIHPRIHLCFVSREVFHVSLDEKKRIQNNNTVYRYKIHILLISALSLLVTVVWMFIPAIRKQHWYWTNPENPDYIQWNCCSTSSADGFCLMIEEILHLHRELTSFWKVNAVFCQ